MMQTFQEWKAWYEAKAEPADPIEGASLYFEPAHGFFYYKVFPGGVLYIDHFATDDYQYLFRKARKIARGLECREVTTQTFHPAKAHLDLKYSTRGANVFLRTGGCYESRDYSCRNRSAWKRRRDRNHLCLYQGRYVCDA